MTSATEAQRLFRECLELDEAGRRQRDREVESLLLRLERDDPDEYHVALPAFERWGFRSDRLRRTLRPIHFTGEWWSESPSAVFDGFSDGRTWNGWLVPMVAEEVLARVAERLDADNRDVPAAERTSFTLIEGLWCHTSWDPEEGRLVSPLETADKNGLRLFDIGCGLCWQAA